MKKIIFAILALGFSYTASAGTDKSLIFMCSIVGFDQKEVKGNCDPRKPKDQMKIPRDWLSPDDKIKVNAKVKFIIDDKQFDQWLAMNKSPLAPKKGKTK